jgi:hypothetical protein
VSRQRVYQITSRADFPRPAADLVQGKVWLADDVEGGIAARRPQSRSSARRLDSCSRKPAERAAPRLEPFELAIDAMLRTDLSAPRKQRHTVRRILARLIAENNAGQLSYSTVRDYVARRRAEIAAEAGARTVVMAEARGFAALLTTIRQRR